MITPGRSPTCRFPETTLFSAECADHRNAAARGRVVHDADVAEIVAVPVTVGNDEDRGDSRVRARPVGPDVVALDQQPVDARGEEDAQVGIALVANDAAVLVGRVDVAFVHKPFAVVDVIGRARHAVAIHLISEGAVETLSGQSEIEQRRTSPHHALARLELQRARGLSECGGSESRTTGAGPIWTDQPVSANCR